MSRKKSCSLAAIILISLFSIESFAITIITQPVATGFGTYVPASKSFSASMALYTIPDSLKNVLYANSYVFSDTVKSLLLKKGFAAVPSNARSMTSIYKQTSLPEIITTDALLHTFYKTYDYMLRIAEYKRFYVQLDSMLTGMLNDVTPLLADAGTDSLGLAVTRAAAYLDVAHMLLTGKMTFADNPTVKSIVMAETSLVYQHQGFANSKVIPELVEDFSQYVPRGHYTLDTIFEHYFRSMMYLGRMNMRDTSRIETMQACILTRLMTTAAAGGINVSDIWAKIYNPTTFFVGRSDDLNYLQYSGVLDALLGNQWRINGIGIIQSNINNIMVGLQKLPKPLILSGLDGTPGFRMMGQRFVPDSYMFGQLVFPNVGNRQFPRGLDLMAILGSQRAKSLLTDLYHENQCPNYTKQLDSLTAEFAAKPASQWADNLYWNWLYTLVPLLQPVGSGYPFFMQNQAWLDKSLVCASGSWAELRHASILYAKQSYTPTVGIDCPYSKCFPQGYVEPNPEVFGRLSAMTAYMKTGFDSVGLSPILPVDKLTNLCTLCVKLQNIAIDELQGNPISVLKYCDIASAYKILAAIEDFTLYPMPTIYAPKTTDSSIACIADVHTDPNTQNVLEVGTGNPMCLYVIVPVEGKLQICRGATFSYYEFTQPMSNRLTDAQWQNMLKNSNPVMPEWVNNYAASKDGTMSYSYYKDITEIIYSNDSIPGAFSRGDSVIATLSSIIVPTITVESKTGSQQFTGVLVNGRYRVAIAPQILGDTNILTVSSRITGYGGGDCYPPNSVDISYRKLLIGTSGAAINTACQTRPEGTRPYMRGNRLILTPGTSWRIVDMRGQQIAFIGPEARLWVASPRLAHKQLLLVPVNSRLQKPMRLVLMGE
jgi:hypothetical protein